MPLFDSQRTSARSGEIRSLSRDRVLKDSLSGMLFLMEF